MEIKVKIMKTLVHSSENSKIFCYFSFNGAGEMALWLTALAELAEDPGPVPSTHMAAHNHL